MKLQMFVLYKSLLLYIAFFFFLNIHFPQLNGVNPVFFMTL